MPSDASVYNLLGAGVTPLLNPLEIQAKKLAIQNEIARQSLIQQEQTKNALALDQARRQAADQQAYRSAMTDMYSSPVAATATPINAAAPPPPPSALQRMGANLGSSLAAAGVDVGSSAPAPAPAAPATAAVPPRPAVPTMADLLSRGVAPADAAGLITHFQAIDKSAAEIDKIRKEAADKQQSINASIQQHAADMANGVLQATPKDQPINPDLLGWHLQNFASLGEPEALQAAQIGKQLAAVSPADQKALLKSLATPKTQEANATSTNAQTTATRLALEAPGIQADNQTKLLTSQGKAPIQPAEAARIALEGRRVAIEAQRVANERKKTEFDQGAIERAGEALAAGDLTRLQDIASLRGDQRLQIFDIAKRLNPKFNTAEVDRRIKNEDYYANGKGADSLRSFNTFLEHAGSASDAVNSIRLSGVPVINKPLNWWREHLSGSADYQRLVTSLEPVRKEFESYLLGGHALQAEDRKAAEKILSENSSPAQIQEALKTLGHTAVARAREENYRYKKVSGHDLDGAFSPEAIDGAKKIGTELKFESAPAAAAHPPDVPKIGGTFNGETVVSVQRVQ